MVKLDQESIITTIESLGMRIEERFPTSSLRKVCAEFLGLAKNSKSYIEWISKPNFLLRYSAIGIILVGLAGLIYSITFIDMEIKNKSLPLMVTMSESIFNDLILIGAAIFFLVTLENRIKRKRALRRLNELRVIAHVVDMHQLTKDPSMLDVTDKTKSSPKHNLSKFELERYLDYCSELTALIAKVAALYAQGLPDPVVVSSVNEIESLSTGLSRKIWQKLNVLSKR